MQRFLLTCAICLGLFAALQLYAQWMAPLTQAVQQPKRPPKMAPASRTTGATHTAVQSWLSSEEWLHTAAIRWQRSEQSFMFAQTVEAAEKSSLDAGAASRGDTIRMQPFAMIWKDERRPDEPPLTVVAQSARVRFENPVFDPSQLADHSINLSGGDAGRILSAALEGQVRITGPDGLVIEGQDFVFSEETAQLYSDHAVNFRYGPPRVGQPVRVQGTSADGLTVEFEPVPKSPLGDDMPRVAEMPKTAQLRGRVAIDFVTQDQGQPTKTRVTSEGPFHYDFQRNIAAFREKVLVSRPRGQVHKDEIECNQLALEFGEILSPRDSQSPDIVPVSGTAPAQPAGPGLISRMELKHIRANAHQNTRSVSRERVLLRSTENGLLCEHDDLQYDAKRRLFILTDPERVDVERKQQGQLQRFEAPVIEIRHTADQQLQQLSGVGAGRFLHRSLAQSQGTPDLWAHWKDRLDLVPNPQKKWTTLTLRGSATVGQLDQMQFSGQTLTAWMPPLEELDTAGVVRLGSDSNSKSASPKFDPDRVPVRRIQATGNVSFVAPGMVGRRIDQVDMTVSPGQVIPLNRPRPPEPGGPAMASGPVASRPVANSPMTSGPVASRPVVSGPVAAGQDEKAPDDSLTSGDPFVFECPQIHGTAVFDAATQQSEIRELHGVDGVLVFRAAPESEGAELPFEQQPVRVTAREFDAFNEGGTRQILTLRGVVDEKGNIREPVIARFGDFAIEGPKIVIDREKNLATVHGQGLLRFPVDHDFSGNLLDPPAIADIACIEKITFDGQRATFLQSVKARLLDNTIRAEEMIAILNGRIDFSADRPDTQGLAIQTMECRDKVSVEMYEYGPQNELVEILKARLHQFDINQVTGKFQGQGPGKIEDWRRTGTRRMLVQSRSTAQSNRPADAHREYPWEYVGIDFKGPVEGNAQGHWGKLNDEVKLMYAPVKNAHLTFKRNDLSSEEANAGSAVWVGSDTLTVGITGDRVEGKPPTVSIEALNNAEMEGRNFYSRAHSLQYEQAKEMFTLRGKGQDKATVNVQQTPGGPFSPLKAQVIHLFPSKQEVSVDGAKTFTTAFGGP